MRSGFAVGDVSGASTCSNEIFGAGREIDYVMHAVIDRGGGKMHSPPFSPIFKLRHWLGARFGSDHSAVWVRAPARMSVLDPFRPLLETLSAKAAACSEFLIQERGEKKKGAGWAREEAVRMRGDASSQTYSAWSRRARNLVKQFLGGNKR